MAALSDYAENKLLDHLLGVAAYTMPAALYVGLFTTDPTDAGTGTEVSGGSYARRAVTFNAAASGATDNASTLTFPTATGDWGTITHFGVFDASSGGNLLVHGALTVNKTVTTGDVFTIPAGDLNVTAD